MVTKNPQNVYRNYFWAILLTFIFDIKIDINICEPHYVNLFFFVNLLHSLHVWLFDIWHLFDNLTSFWHFDTSIKLKPPQPAQGYFLHSPHVLEDISLLCGTIATSVWISNETCRKAKVMVVWDVVLRLHTAAYFQYSCAILGINTSIFFQN